MEKTLVDHLSAKTTWIRLAKMILFGVILWVVRFIIGIVAVVQWLLLLTTGSTNPRLSSFGRSLGSYDYQIAAYLSFHTEYMPYPFAPWPWAGPLDPMGELPAPESRSDSPDETESEPAKKTTPARKPRKTGTGAATRSRRKAADAKPETPPESEGA